MTSKNSMSLKYELKVTRGQTNVTTEWQYDTSGLRQYVAKSRVYMTHM